MKTSFRIRMKSLVTIAASTAVAVGATLGAPVAHAAPTTLSDAVFTWGINDESGAGAYDGSCNYISAGLAGDSGSSRAWTESDKFLKGTENNVTVYKPSSSGPVEQAWETRCQTGDGAKVQPWSAPNSTGNLVQFVKGSGVYDADAGTAEISWSGSFTVAFYDGLTYWSASNPTLSVADGKGTVKAHLTGYSASQDGSAGWGAVDGGIQDIATLSDIAVTTEGVTSTTDYLGVTVTGVSQSTSGQYFGSFPQKFVDFQSQTGQSSYWYSSGGSGDARKVASVVTVDFDSTDAVKFGDTTDPDEEDPDTEEPSTPEGVAYERSDASLSWGVNPASGRMQSVRCNFFTATAEYTRGDEIVPTDGANVSIIKTQADGTEIAANSENMCLDAAGAPVNDRSAANFSGIGVHFTNGEATLWPENNSADIKWLGSFTGVIADSREYTVTNPRLYVINGKGTIKADLAIDYSTNPYGTVTTASDVTIAELTDVKVGPNGFTVQPDYLKKVITTTSAAQDQQLLDDEWTGGFPQEFVDFNAKNSITSFFYSIARTNLYGPNDQKVASPAKVSYDTLVSDTEITVVPDSTSAIESEKIVFTATVTPATTGNAEFFVNGTSVGTVDLVDGKASLEIANLPVGNHEVTAKFTSADISFNDSESSAVKFSVTAKEIPNPDPQPQGSSLFESLFSLLSGLGNMFKGLFTMLFGATYESMSS